MWDVLHLYTHAPVRSSPTHQATHELLRTCTVPVCHTTKSCTHLFHSSHLDHALIMSLLQLVMVVLHSLLVCHQHCHFLPCFRHPHWLYLSSRQLKPTSSNEQSEPLYSRPSSAEDNNVKSINRIVKITAISPAT